MVRWDWEVVIRGRQGSACERGEDSDLVTRWAGGRTQVALNFAGSGITLATLRNVEQENV